MYNENISRTDLITIIEKFRPVLCIYQYEDPCIGEWNALYTNKALN